MQKLSNNAGAKPKQSGRQEILALRITRDGVIPNSIENLRQLTLDAATKVALTSASVKLVVEIDTTGTRTFLADQRTGQIIGGPADLSKLTGIRAFVTKERKSALGIEIARRVGEIAYRASLTLTHQEPGYVQKSLDSTYGPMIRPYLIILDRLKTNLEKLNENENDTLKEIFEPIIRQYFVRIRNAYYAHIVLLTKGQSEKGQLNKELFQRGVPEYVHTKFTSNNFVLEKSQELARVLFTSDPAKGLALTVKEWRTQEFRTRTPFYLLSGSALISTLLLNDDFVKTFSNIEAKEEVSLEDETNLTVSRLLKSKVSVMPPMRNSEYVTTPGSKNKQWRFPTPSLDSPQGVLPALGYAMLRVYSGNLQTVDLVSDFYQVITGGAVRKELVNPTNNFYVQWANADFPDDAWIGATTGSTNEKIRSSMWRWLRMELRLSETGTQGTALRQGLLLTKDLKCSTFQKEEVNESTSEKGKKVVNYFVNYNNPVATKPWLESPREGVFDLLGKPSELEKIHVSEFIEKYFPKKIGKDKTAGANQLTTLSSEAKSFIKKVSELSKPLGQRMTVWFRGFSEQRLQVAAVKLAKAQFDELFVEEDLDEVVSGSDESENDSEAD